MNTSNCINSLASVYRVCSCCSMLVYYICKHWTVFIEWNIWTRPWTFVATFVMFSIWRRKNVLLCALKHTHSHSWTTSGEDMMNETVLKLDHFVIQFACVWIINICLLKQPSTIRIQLPPLFIYVSFIMIRTLYNVLYTNC